MQTRPTRKDETGCRIHRLRASGHGATCEAAVDLAEDKRTFVAAVEAELSCWDAYLERLQVKAATEGSAREKAEAVISHLRRHRNSLGERLGAVRSASAERWRDGRKSVDAARDELARMAAELTAGLERRGEP